jgi:hypothetical protein
MPSPRGPAGAALLGGGAPSSSAPSTPSLPRASTCASTPGGGGGGGGGGGRARASARHPFGPRLSTLIGRLGRRAAERPRGVLAACLGAAFLCASLVASGAVAFKVETDAAALWLPRAVAASAARYVGGFEAPALAVARARAREGASVARLPQLAEALRLDEAPRAMRRRGEAAGAATPHGNLAEVEVTAVAAGSSNASRSAFSWRDLLLAGCWLPVRARARPGGVAARPAGAGLAAALAQRCSPYASGRGRRANPAASPGGARRAVR